MKLILNRKKRIKRDIKLSEFWYIVDNTIPIEPRLVRKEFKREELAKDFIKKLRLSGWYYDIIPGNKAIKYKLNFIDWGEQTLPRVYVKDYIYPEHIKGYQQRKSFRNAHRLKNKRFKANLIKKAK